MLSFMNLKTSSATLAEWSPSDWPESLSEMRTIDNLLRCSICYEYFDVAMIVPDCSHNYCSLCIRRSLSYETQCPTCMLKVNPPSLKSNRVLDELVKNFIKVRTKLLELVTKGDQATSETVDHKKGGQVKNKSSLTSNKRRKAHSRPENRSKSSSPDTKRPKLEEAGEEEIANPVDVTEKTETESSFSSSVPEVVVIDTEDNQKQHVTSEQEPMVVEDGTSERLALERPAGPDFSECPVCGDMVSHRKINSHLDACLTRREKKSSLRRKKSSEPKSICSTSTKRKHSPNVEAKESDAVSSDDSLSCGTTQPCSSNAARSSSTVTTKGSNSLIQTVQKRKPLPKLVYSVMADKELRQRLKEWSLSTKGDKSTLVRRHQDFIMLYNAQCDAAKPMTAAQVAREVEKAEKTRAKEASSLTEASTSGLRFDKNQSEEDKDKTRQNYLNRHQNEFDKLIADIQRRQRGKGKKTAIKTSVVECLDTKMNELGENVIKPENNNSGNTKSNYVEITNSTDNSDICLEICPPFLKENNKDSSTVNESETSSSIIPEPPSSPSLLSLPDEEEFTPSLGLEGDDDDDGEEEEECKDEFGDTVIPESPVIKVGKAADGTTDRETVTSESDEDFPQRHSSISNKRVKSNLF